MRPPKPESYWESRYREGRGSGRGSEGELGEWKAAFVNDFLRQHDLAIWNVIDWGCGDGQVLRQLELDDVTYVGVDVSPTIINRLSDEFPHLTFRFPEQTGNFLSELSLSMDVLFHFPDDDDYFSYLNRLFTSSTRYVLIYSTDYDGGQTARHVRRRNFTSDVHVHFPDWTPYVEWWRDGPDEASFFAYRRVEK